MIIDNEVVFGRCRGCGEFLKASEIKHYNEDLCHVIPQRVGFDEWEPEPCGPVEGYMLFDDYLKIKAERDEADRRAGSAERSLAHAKDSLLAHDRWNHDRKVELGYDPMVSFDVVYADLKKKAGL